MPAKQQPDNRCQYITSDGRRCGMPAAAGSPDSSLCFPHGQRQPAAPALPALSPAERDEGSAVEGAGDADSIGPELLGPFEEFRTATAINHVLGKLFALLARPEALGGLARNRIPVRNAAVLAYIGQLLLHILPAVRKETALAQGLPGWERVVRRALSRRAGQARGAVLPEPQNTTHPAVSEDEKVLQEPAMPGLPGACRRACPEGRRGDRRAAPQGGASRT